MEAERRAPRGAPRTYAARHARPARAPARPVAVALALAVASLAGCVAPTVVVEEAPGVPTEALAFDTSGGAFTVVLYPEAAPETVALMKAYAAEGYFEGREFNRAVPGHVVQIIDRAGGLTEDPRRVPLEVDDAHMFSEGAVGVARGEDPESGGPEIFVMDFATSHLHRNYTVWGQVVDGMGVVHRAARADAVAYPSGPVLSEYFTDRQSLDPLVVRAVTLVTLDLPADVAAGLPRVVAQNAREGDFRHSLEWPRTLRAGVPTELAWFARPYNETPPPPPEAVRVRVGDAELPVAGDPDAPGAYYWSWTPPAPGRYEATLAADGRAMATLVVRVPA